MDLHNLIKHRYTGYVLEAAKFLVLLGAVLHVGDRVITLENSGCTAYYQSFNDLNKNSSYTFYNKTEYREFRNPEKPNYQLKNYSSENNFVYN